MTERTPYPWEINMIRQQVQADWTALRRGERRQLRVVVMLALLAIANAAIAGLDLSQNWPNLGACAFCVGVMIVAWREAATCHRGRRQAEFVLYALDHGEWTIVEDD